MGTSVLPVLFALFMWWFLTGIVLYAVGLPRLMRSSLMGSVTIAAVFAFYSLYALSDDTSVTGAFAGFTCGLVVWGWHEMSFLTGLITGPRTTALPGRGDAISNKPAPLGASIETVIYHEAAIAITLALAAVATLGGTNQTGLWTLVILWLMRLSAKFNIYLGVPNLTEQFLPDHLAYLKGYFCRRPMNMLFPIAVTVSTIVTLLLAIAALDTTATAFESTSLTLLATLMALAVVEHWFMVIPLPTEQLWSWGLTSREVPPARDAGHAQAAHPKH